MFYVSYDFTINQLPQHLEQAMYHDPFYSALSLVHTCATRHDSMRHDRTEDQGTTIFKFGATHTRHDHATRLIYYKLYGNFVMYS